MKSIYNKKIFEKVISSGIFNEKYYLEKYPDVGISEVSPLEHFCLIGMYLGRNPSSLFCRKTYLELNPDIKEAGIDCIHHYIKFGIDEKRLISRNNNSLKKTRFSKEQLDQFTLQPKISIIIPTYNTEVDLLNRCIESVINQEYSNWEICIVDDGSTNNKTLDALLKYKEYKNIKIELSNCNRGIAESTNVGINISEGEYIAFLDHDDELTSNALALIIERINKIPLVDVIYTDQDKIDVDGNVIDTFYKPAWSPAYLKGVMYVGHLLVMRKEFIVRIGCLKKEFDGVQDYELMLRASEATSRIEHIDKVCYHWRAISGSIASHVDAKQNISKLQKKAVDSHFKRIGTNAYAEEINKSHRIRILPVNKDPKKVSILICNKNNGALLRKCLESIFSNTFDCDFEVIIADNGSSEESALKTLKDFAVKVFYKPEKFHYAAFNNFLANQASGELLLFLNNDTEVLSSNWLDNMKFYINHNDVGAVGAKLIYPDKTIQHAGVVLGTRGTADHIMRNFPYDCDGYAGSLICDREVSAVTAACLMIKKKVFNDVNGFNELYKNHYEDVDLCLKLRIRGYRNIYSSNTLLIHHESKTRGKYYNYNDRILLLDYWEDYIKTGDQYFNSNFNLQKLDYSSI
jgi:GT2 family glycosyltransferase